MKMKKVETEAVASDGTETEQEDEEYAVEKICGRRVRRGKVSHAKRLTKKESNQHR